MPAKIRELQKVIEIVYSQTSFLVSRIVSSIE